MIYDVVPADQMLTQGDVFDGCPIAREQLDGSVNRHRERVIVMTQACDIVQAKADQIVVAVLYTTDEIVQQGQLKAPAIRFVAARSSVGTSSRLPMHRFRCPNPS